MLLLQRKLDVAVEEESYEEASGIRDELQREAESAGEGALALMERLKRLRSQSEEERLDAAKEIASAYRVDGRAEGALAAALKDESDAIAAQAEKALLRLWEQHGDGKVERKLAEGSRLMTAQRFSDATQVINCLGPFPFPLKNAWP